PKQHPSPCVVLGTFPDAEKLRRGAGSLTVERDEGRVLIGPAAEVAAAKSWAFQTLAKEAPPQALTAEVWMDRVLARYRADSEARPERMGALAMHSVQMTLDAEVRALVALGSQSSRFTIAVDATEDDASVDLALAALPGTGLDHFTRGQKPIDPA